jgi:integrase
MEPIPTDNGARPVALELERWADRLRAAGRARETVAVRVRVVRALYRDLGALEVGAVDEAGAERWIGRAGLSAATRRQYAVTWRQWCQWIGTPTDLPIPRAPRGVPRPARLAPLTSAQLAAPPLEAAWIACGRWAGLRASEVAGLRGEDVDAAGGVLYVDGKGGQRAAVPLHPRLGAALAPWVEASSGGRLWPASPHTVSRRAGRILREHGAADRFHQLRHFYGTAVYQATGDLYRAQRALRHASPATTQVYAQLADDALRAAVAAVP